MNALLNILENELYQGYPPRYQAQYQPYGTPKQYAPTEYGVYGEYEAPRQTRPQSRYLPAGYAAGPRYQVRYEPAEEENYNYTSPCFAPFGRYIQPKQTVPEIRTRQDADNFYINIIDDDIAAKTLKIDYQKKSNKLLIIIEQYNNIYKSKLPFPEEIDYNNISAKYSSTGATIVVPKLKQEEEEEEEEEQEEVAYYTPQDLLNALFNQMEYRPSARVEYKPKQKVEYRPKQTVHYYPQVQYKQPVQELKSCQPVVKAKPNVPKQKQQCQYVTFKPVQKSEPTPTKKPVQKLVQNAQPVQKTEPVQTPQVQYLDLSELCQSLFGQMTQDQEKKVEKTPEKPVEKVATKVADNKTIKSELNPAAEFYQALFNQMAAFNQPQQQENKDDTAKQNFESTSKLASKPSGKKIPIVVNNDHDSDASGDESSSKPKPVSKPVFKPVSKPATKPVGKKIPVAVSINHDSDASGDETPDEEIPEQIKKPVKPIKVTLEEVEDEQGYLSI